MARRLFKVIGLLAGLICCQSWAAENVDASQVTGVLDLTSSETTVTVSNIGSLTQIVTSDGQSVSLDGAELHTLSQAGSTLTISGGASIDITNSGLSLPNDGSSPTVSNLLALEFEGNAANLSLVPERLTLDGSHTDAIAAFWIQLDQLYVGANDFYNLAINTSFVYLGNDYAHYLLEGNDARLDIVKISSDRQQTLHDNLLGNLGDSPIADRFTNQGQSDPRTADGSFFGDRPYNRGTASNDLYTDLDLVSSVIGWDLARDIKYPSTLTFPFAVFDSANTISGTTGSDDLFAGAGDDEFDGGTGTDTVVYSGDLADYTISSDNGSFLVVDGVADRDGSDTLTGIEQLKFADETLLLVGGNDFSIQSAINAASAGDTIRVAAGTYTENISINTATLSLLGEQAGIDGRTRSGQPESIIDGGIVLSGASDDVVIDGFTIKQNGAGVGISLDDGAHRVVVRNNILESDGTFSSSRGIRSTTDNSDISGLTVSFNKITGWRSGLHIQREATASGQLSDAIQISDNDISDNFVGIGVETANDTVVTITRNVFDNNEFEGIGIASSSSLSSITDNDFSNNGTQLANGAQLAVYFDVDPTISGNSFDRSVRIGTGASVYSSIQAAIDIATAGDTLTVGAGNYVENLTVGKENLTLSGAQAGVDARGRSGQTETVLQGGIVLTSSADGFTLDGFTVSQTGEATGVWVEDGAKRTTIQNNILTSDSSFISGRAILTPTDNTEIDGFLVRQNKISGWRTGVYVEREITGSGEPNRAVITDNDISDNFVGIGIEGPSTTIVTITGNNITGSTFEGIGVGTTNTLSTISGNSFSSNETHINNVYDTQFDSSNNSLGSTVTIAGGSTFYSSIQSAIEAASDDDTLLIYPGSYTESANYDKATNSNSGDNPLGLLINKSLTLQGVDSDGNAITDKANVQATVTSETQSGWGTNFFVTADDVSIQGLKLVATSSASIVNKAIEVVQNNFTLQDSIVTAEDGLAMASAVYFNDESVPADGSFTTSAISDYAVYDSQLFGSVVITNGPGIGHSADSLSMEISGNEFQLLPENLDSYSGFNGIFVTGNDDSVSWRNAAAAVPTEISGNSFGDTVNNILWVRGDDSQTFPSTDYVENLIDDNIIPAYAYAVDSDGEISVGTYGAVSSMAIRSELADFSNQELANATALVSLTAGGSSPVTTVLQLFDQNVTPDILYGSGNSNGAFTRSVNNNVEVGLRIKDRFVGTNHSNGDGTYSPDAGFYSGDSGPGIWNFDFSVNLNQDGGLNPRLFNEVSVALLIDLDPTTGTSYLTLDPLTVWSDNAYGDNTTANGEGDDTAETNAELGVSSNFTIFQNSQNIGWLYNTDGETLFDVTRDDSTYDFKLIVSDLNDNVLAQTSMQVLVGNGGQTEDREISALRFPDGNLQSCVNSAALDQGITLVSEMTSLSCTSLSLTSAAGVDQLGSLTSLNLSNNQLTTINIDNLNDLQTLTITGNSLDQDTIAYLDALDGSNGLQITRVIVVPPSTGGSSGGGSGDEEDEEEDIPDIPVTPPIPTGEITETTEAIEEEINDIVIPDDGEEISEETVEAIDSALDNVADLAEDIREQVESGDITNDDAIEVLDTLSNALNLAGDAAEQGADIDETNVTESVTSITNILNALDNEEPLEQSQVEQLQQVTERALDTVADLIDEESTDEEVEALVSDIEELLVSTERTGAGLDENIVAAAQTLSQKALDNTLDDIASEVGIEPTDTTDVEATQELLRENAELLDRVLEVASVELPSTAELDTVALVDNLEANGLDSSTAEELTEDLAQFVNPIGVNLELTNGTSVNALDAMVESVGDSSTTISVDELTGSLLVDLGETEVPVNVAKVAVVPPAVPEGVTVLPDGSALSVADGVAVTIVPAPKDPIGLVSSLAPAVGDIDLETNGGITITSGDGETFSGTFGFDDSQGSGAGTVDEVTLNVPEEGDASDPNFTYTVDYPDGSRQTIAPFVADDSFFDSLGSRGLSFNTSRSTGIVTVIDEGTNSVSEFRPDYFVTPLTDSDQSFLDANADETGIAYRAIDVNGDGIQDFEAVSASGVQIIYGLP